MSYNERYSVRDIALIRGIDLLTNMLTRLDSYDTSVDTTIGEWIQSESLGWNRQLKIIRATSGSDKESRYLLYCFSKLNQFKLKKVPTNVGDITGFINYLRRLIGDCIDAIQRAQQAHSYSWSEATKQTILNSLGTSSVTKNRPFPYYDEGENGKEKKKEKQEVKVIEYRPMK